MKKRLTLALLLMLAVPRAFANNPGADFLAYLQGKYPNKVIGVSGITATCRIDYSPTAVAADITTIETEKQSFDFSVKPNADPTEFKKAMNADPAMPDTIKVQLTPYLILVDSYTADPAGTKAAWLRVKTVLGIDPTIAAGIEQYAAAFNMPLK